jgi:beta-lactamase regulating signal transducer with metallopeptidase domain
MIWWLIQHLATTTLLVAVVAVVCRRIPKRPALQHALWLVVLVKFVIPPIVAAPWSLPDLGHTLGIDSITSLWFPEGFSGAPADISSAAAGWGTAEGAWHVTKQGALAVWLLGILVVAARQCRVMRRYGRIVRRAEAAPDYLSAQVDRIARVMGNRTVPVVLARDISSPFIWCVGRLRLVWPAELTGRSDVARLQSVVAHELAHVERRDHWVAWLELIVGAVWWWNPLAWFVRRRLREAAEMACDARAVNLLPEERREFASALLELSTAFSFEPTPALGVRSANRSAFERRLKMIMSRDAVGRVSWRGLAVVALLAALMLPTWTAGEEPKGQSTPARTEKTLYSWQLAFADAKQDGKVGFYLAESTAGEGLKQAKVGDQGETIYLHAEPVLTSQDVAEAKLTKNATNETEIEVVFTKAGEEKISKATAANLGKRLAIVVNGAVVSAPTIRSPIGNRGMISGRFSDEEWAKIATSLQPKN